MHAWLSTGRQLQQLECFRDRQPEAVQLPRQAPIELKPLCS